MNGELFSTGEPMPKGVRDPNLDCEAVKKYREIVHLQMNYIQRAYVAETVECTPRGLAIWEAVLIECMANGFNPKGIPKMLKMWELMYYS